MSAARHRTGTGHLPDLRAVSWSCTRGEAHVDEYGHSVDAEFALRLADLRATTHRTTARLRELRP